MGWLIVVAAILIVCGILVYLDYHYAWDNIGVQSTSGILGIFSFIAILAIGCSMIEQKSDAKIFIEDYNQTVKMASELTCPSDAIVEKTLNLNNEILEHQVKSNRFMTKGLYSKEIGSLPLLDIPEIMKFNP